MKITNATGHVVLSLGAPTSESVSGNVVLLPGTYTILFTAHPQAASGLAPVTYQLNGQTLTDPQGPESTDPTGDPSGSPGTNPNSGPDLANGSGAGIPPQDPTTAPASERQYALRQPVQSRRPDQPRRR